MHIASRLAPTNSIGHVLLERKASYFHALLYIFKVFTKVYNRKSVDLIFDFVFYGEIEPFVVSFSVGIILDEKNVVICFDKAFIGTK